CQRIASGIMDDLSIIRAAFILYPLEAGTVYVPHSLSYPRLNGGAVPACQGIDFQAIGKFQYLASVSGEVQHDVPVQAIVSLQRCRRQDRLQTVVLYFSSVNDTTGVSCGNIQLYGNNLISGSVVVIGYIQAQSPPQQADVCSNFIRCGSFRPQRRICKAGGF